jgi:hypothetical protein
MQLLANKQERSRNVVCLLCANSPKRQLKANRSRSGGPNPALRPQIDVSRCRSQWANCNHTGFRPSRPHSLPLSAPFPALT